MSDNITKMLATWFYVGRSPFAPGTLASAVGAAMAAFLLQYPFFYFLVLILVTVLGLMVSGPMEQLENKKDPGCVVIDEVAGIMIAFIALPMRWDVIFIAFFLFRAFDMFKIYPVNKFEEIGGGTGIMMDDVVAGIYTLIVMQMALRWSGVI